MHSLKDISLAYQNETLAWLEPMFQAFDIEQGCITRVFFNGGFYGLNSHQAMWSHYLDSEYHLYDPLLMAENYTCGGVFRWVDCQDKFYQQYILKDFRHHFGISQGVTVIDQDNQGYVSVALGCQQDDEQATSLIMHCADLIKVFIREFSRKENSFIGEIRDQLFDLRSAKPPSNINYKKKWGIIQRWRFLRAMNKLHDNDAYLMNVSLSRREKECAQLYLSGKTTHESADALGLKYPTVIDYFESLKKKLKVRYKKELLLVLSKFGLLTNFNYCRKN